MSLNELNYAGQFEVITCELITANGNIVNLRASLLEVNFYEDIFKSVLTGNIVAFSSDDLLSKAQIIGQERLKLRIKTPSKPDDEDINFVDTPLFVHRVSGKTQVSQRGFSFILHFMSPEMITNQRTRISQSYKKEVSGIVNSIMRDEIGTKRPLTIQKTVGTRKIVVPNMHPYDTIRMLTTEALSDDNNSPHYLFYETLSGFHFRTIDDLYRQQVTMNYNDGVGNIADSEQQPHRNIQYQYEKVLDFQANPSFDTLKNITSGVLGSKLYLHDVFTKKYYEYEHKYFDNFNDFERTNSINSPVYSDDNEFGTFPDTKIHLHPTSRVPLTQEGAFVDGYHVSADTSVENLISNQIENSILSRQAKMFELGQPIRGITLTVNGITSIHAGDMINFTNNEVNLDGKYLIKNTRHYFNLAEKRHEVIMQAVADSVESIIE